MLQTKAVEAYCVFLQAQGRAKRTLQTNRERLKYLQKFVSQKKVDRLEEITPELLDQYIASLYQRGLSKFTIAGRVQVIKTFFRWCVQRNYLSRSPASQLKKPRLNYAAKEKAIYQKDLETMILYAHSAQAILEEVMLMFFADTGCRAGELCSINISDVDFTNMEVFVDGKTGTRLLDFTDRTAKVLKRYLLTRKDEMFEKSDAFFVYRDGERITPAQVYICFRRIARKLSIKRFNPHAIRHRVAQGWLDQGANLELVRIKLGHADIRTTAAYYANQDRKRAKQATQKYCIIKNI